MEERAPTEGRHPTNYGCQSPTPPDTFTTPSSADSIITALAIGNTPSFISLYSTASTKPRQLASTIFAETPTVPQFVFPSPEVTSTRTKLAEPDNELLMTRTL